MENYKGILITEELNELMKSTPSWPIRIGIGLISLLLITTLIFSWFIQFPQSIEVEMQLQSNSPLSRVIINKATYVDSLLVEDKTKVSKGQILAFLGVKSISNKLDKLNQIIQKSDHLFSLDTLPSVFRMLSSINEEFTKKGLEIERLHNAYIQFENEVESKQELRYLMISEQQSTTQIKILKEELALRKQKFYYDLERFQMDSSLFADSVISRSEFLSSLEKITDEKSRFISAKRDLQLQFHLHNELQQKLATTKFLITKERNHLKSEISLVIEELKSMIDRYRIANSVVAPRAGVVNVSSEMSKGKFLRENTEIFTIESDISELVGMADVESSKGGRLDIGQRVFVNFDPYPSFEYGRVEGILTKINPIQTNGHYRIHFSLPKDLMTDRAIAIPYLPEMTGKVRIICKEQSLLERLFLGLRKRMQ